MVSSQFQLKANTVIGNIYGLDLLYPPSVLSFIPFFFLSYVNSFTRHTKHPQPPNQKKEKKLLLLTSTALLCHLLLLLFLYHTVSRLLFKPQTSCLSTRNIVRLCHYNIQWKKKANVGQ